MRIETWGRICDKWELMAFYFDAFDEVYEDLATHIAWTGPKWQSANEEREELTARSPKRTHVYVHRNSVDDFWVEVWMRSEYDEFHEHVRDLLKKHGFGMVQR